MDDDTILACERRLWIGGAAAYDALLDEAALMAFPQMGVLEADMIRDSLRQAPPWDSVVFADIHIARPGEAIVVIGYRAQAKRVEIDYRCLCTSTYRRANGAWRIVQHHQSPID